jgi:hypothetical protein
MSVRDHALSYFEGKTGNSHREIILNSIGLGILEKYDFTLPHVPSNFRMNANLKAIGRILEWDEIKRIPKYDAFGKVSSIEEVPLMNVFSTKFMRKTAASIDNYLGIPIKTSMSRTGHKTFAAFSRYVDVNRESLDHANRQWDMVFEKGLVEKVTTVDASELIVAA